jgi:hypothetical protein
MVLDSSGNLGIGGTPSEKLTVDSGNIQLTNGNYIIFDGPTPKQTKMRSYYDGETHLAMTVANSSVLDLTSSSIKVPDSVYLQIGSSNDLGIVFNGTDSIISNVTGDIKLQNNADDKDIIFEASAGSASPTELLRLDGSASSINVPDNVDLKIGSGNDLGFGHDGTNSTIFNTEGDLRFIQYKDDKMIRFYNDNGSGGTVEYFRVDGASEETVFSKQLRLIDNAKLTFGASSDLEIYHDGSNSYIDETGQGDLIIKGSDDVYIFAGSDIAINCNDNSEVSLWHNNVKKAETTADGFKCTGALRLTEISTPTATADHGKIYTKSDNKLYFQDGAGTEHEIAFV